MNIREVLSTKGDSAIFSIEPDQLVAEAVKRMIDQDVGSLLVLRNGELVGFITERGILRGMHTLGCSLCDIKVSELMEQEPLVVALEDSVDYAREAMTKSRSSHLIVMEEGRVSGVISFHDVARPCLKDAHFENALLKRYIKNWPE